MLRSKTNEFERAIRDVIEIVAAFSNSMSGSEDPSRALALIQHYDHFYATALLNAIKVSLNTLKKRVVSSRMHTLEIFASMMEKPFFELEVVLQGQSVAMTPSIDDVQHAVNIIAVSIIGSAQAIPDWHAKPVSELGIAQLVDYKEEDEGELEPEIIEGATYFDRVGKSLEVARVALLLTGSFLGAKAEVASFVTSFSEFSWLWLTNAEDALRDFIKGNPSAGDYESELAKFSVVDESIQSIPPVRTIGAISVSTLPLRQQLRQLLGHFKQAYCEHLHRAASAGLHHLTDRFRSLYSKLNREPDGLSSIKFLMDTLKEIRELEPMIDQLIQPVLDMFSLLEFYMPENFSNKVEMDQRALLRVNWAKVVERAETASRHVASLQAGFRKRLVADVKLFRVDAQDFRKEYLATGPGVVGLAPSEAIERLRRYEDEFDILHRKQELYCDGEDLFALPRTSYPELDATSKELQLLSKLYGLYKDVMTRMEEWHTILWTDVVANIQSMNTEMESFASRCKKLPGKLRQWDAFGTLNKRIEDAQAVLPLLQELSKPSLRPRHWEAVEKLCGVAMNVSDAEFKLAVLLDAKLVDRRDEVLEITDGADKELQIQKKLEDTTAKWQTTRFFFNSWKARGVATVAGAGTVLEELEESQMNLQTMLTMRNVGVFREEVQAELKVLCDTSETLELWQKVQMLWCSLESVFLGGDIARQMPVVAKRFQKVDKDFVNIMLRSQELGIVVEACANEILRMLLPTMFEELERCQKSLEGYLEQKRNKFPRFYFVSNPVLLQILSQGSDPQAIQAYYEKVFDSISCVEHDKKDKSIIRDIISREGRAEETINLRRPVRAAGNIEDWLMDLLQEMQYTMKELCEQCAIEISMTSAELSNLRKFVDNSCGQYALLGLQLMWTNDTETALVAIKKEKNALRDVTSKASNVLSTLSSWCLQDLGTKLNRMKIETLVTVQVHMRDVLNDIYSLYRAKRIAGADDFEWLKQMRFYWNPDGADALNDKGCCTIKVTDVPFEYQFEYLGCKERLVITPLTDRCYITLAQAMGMNYGGSPAGPAGTGKTETVKDMGRSIGIYVVVTNCTDQMRYVDCAKIFKGLCMAGLWGCFDEFNRITLPVLSVVAQQILAILNAKKANASTFNFPGDIISVNLNPAFGAFITMNPGYAGRQELPENLKALFRGVAMMVPDREIIMKVKLCSVGYINYRHLARKFFICYQLCEEQLSKQKHYDFGLRNILICVTNRWSYQTKNLDADEEMLLYRTYEI
jgi:dynein heavy chain